MRNRLNSTRGLIVIVACVAAGCFAFITMERGFSQSEFGSLFVGAAVLGIASIRSEEVVSKRRNAGDPATPTMLWHKHLFESLLVAAIIVGLADVGFVLGYGLLVGGNTFFLFSYYPRAQRFCGSGFVFGCAAGLTVGYLSRRALWHSDCFRKRLRRALVPLSLVALLWLANMLSQQCWGPPILVPDVENPGAFW